MPTFASPQKIFYGEEGEALDQLEFISGQKVFIITDAMLQKLGVLQLLTNKLDEFGKEWSVFTEVEPDPKEGTVLKATEKCKEYGPDLIIGLGGGSSLDAAKAVWFLYEHEEFEIDDLNPFTEMHMGVKSKCVAIPTTAGTGAEVTWAVIISRIDDDGKEMKLELSSFDVVPPYAIIDPIFTKSLPPSLTAATGFDAIAHSFEALISDWKNIISDGLAIQALVIIKDNLVQAVEHGDDMDSRRSMAVAATMAGLAFGNSQVCLGHAMGHALGAVFHITHGNTVGLLLPYVLQYALNNPDGEEIEILGNTALRLGFEGIDQKSKAQTLIKWVQDLSIQVKLPTKLSDLKVTEAQLNENMDRLIELANESASISMNLRETPNENLEKLFRYAFEGKPIDF